MDQCNLWSPNENNWNFIFAFKIWKAAIWLDGLMQYDPDPLSVIRDVSAKGSTLIN
jgi:hypothetical protein